jgi:hypothetical protein
MRLSRWSRFVSCFLLALILAAAGVPRVASAGVDSHHAGHEIQHGDDCHSALPDDQGHGDSGHSSCCCMAPACSFSMNAVVVSIDLTGGQALVILPPLAEDLAERNLSPPTEPPRA